MNLSKFFIGTAILVLFSLNTKKITSLSFFSNKISNTIEDEKVPGGPRTVIQAMTTVVVSQTAATNLYISILDSTGEVVIDQATQSLETTISVIELKQGIYIIKTVDDDNDVQVFTITIE